MDSARSIELISATNGAIAEIRPGVVIFIKANIKTLNISLKGIKVETSEHLALDGRLNRNINDEVFSKTASSAFTIAELLNFLELDNITHIYLSGIYLGKCLTDTALDGIEHGFTVSVIKETVSAAKPSRSEILLRKLERNGVEIISTAQLSEQINLSQ